MATTKWDTVSPFVFMGYLIESFIAQHEHTISYIDGIIDTSNSEKEQCFINVELDRQTPPFLIW